MIFDPDYFKKMDFSLKQVDSYLISAVKDMKIAEKYDDPEVRFEFVFKSLIKFGITLIASYGYKVSSRKGHHRKVLEKMSEILNNEEILIVLERIRKTRNTEFYDGGTIITRKQSDEYLSFLKEIYNLSKSFLSDKDFNLHF
ncbi:MAG: hypothetical protein PHV76_04335 [Bacteroidales bacterium]|nr:hypothetical protein [Bacteroidales bacterium]